MLNGDEAISSCWVHVQTCVDKNTGMALLSWRSVCNAHSVPHTLPAHWHKLCIFAQLCPNEPILGIKVCLWPKLRIHVSRFWVRHWWPSPARPDKEQERENFCRTGALKKGVLKTPITRQLCIFWRVNGLKILNLPSLPLEDPEAIYSNCAIAGLTKSSVRPRVFVTSQQTASSKHCLDPFSKCWKPLSLKQRSHYAMTTIGDRHFISSIHEPLTFLWMDTALHIISTRLLFTIITVGVPL